PLQDRKITPENNPQAPPLLAFRTPETVPRLGFFPVNGPRVSGTPENASQDRKITPEITLQASPLLGLRTPETASKKISQP
ncbi:TPA: hypothetical protein ACRN3K_002278, partial [Pseudomonas aeruginosa]